MNLKETNKWHKTAYFINQILPFFTFEIDFALHTFAASKKDNIMVDIKPDEISAILKSQLSNMDVESNLEEIGTVLQVGDGIARIYGLNNVSSGELVEFENGVKAIALNLEEDNVGVVLMGDSGDIKEGGTVKRTGKIASIKVGDGLAGRVINTLGEPIDGKGPITGELFEMPLERKAPGVIFREPVKQPLQTGIKAIDAMIPIGRGQRELVIGDLQTGKSAICIDTIINQKEFFQAGKPVYCIYVAIGQKASTIANVMKVLEDKDDFTSILDDCIKLLDDNMDVLNDIEYSLESEKEDYVITDLTKNDLVNMAHDVADSSRIKRAESQFSKRFFEQNSD